MSDRRNADFVAFDALTERIYRAKKALNKRLAAARSAAERAAIKAEKDALSDEWYATFLVLCQKYPSERAELPSERDARLSKEAHRE